MVVFNHKKTYENSDGGERMDERIVKFLKINKQTKRAKKSKKRELEKKMARKKMDSL